VDLGLTVHDANLGLDSSSDFRRGPKHDRTIRAFAEGNFESFFRVHNLPEFGAGTEHWESCDEMREGRDGSLAVVEAARLD